MVICHGRKMYKVKNNLKQIQEYIYMYICYFQGGYTPEDQHGTWEYTPGKGKSSSKPSFSGSMLIFRGVSFFISLNKKSPTPPSPCCNTDCPCARVASAAWATGCTKEAPYCFMSSTASSTCPGVQGGGESWRTSYFLGVFRKKQTFGQNEMTTKKDPFNTLFQKVLEDVL